MSTNTIPHHHLHDIPRSRHLERLRLAYRRAREVFARLRPVLRRRTPRPHTRLEGCVCELEDPAGPPLTSVAHVDDERLHEAVPLPWMVSIELRLNTTAGPILARLSASGHWSPRLARIEVDAVLARVDLVGARGR